MPSNIIFKPREIVITSAVTQVTFSDLQGVIEHGYDFEFIFVNVTGGIAGYNAYFNGDQTAANYRILGMYHLYGGAAATGDANGSPLLENVLNNIETTMVGSITVSPLGFDSLDALWRRRDTTGATTNDLQGIRTMYHLAARAGEFTKIEIISTVANGIGVGSRFRLVPKRLSRK